MKRAKKADAKRGDMQESFMVSEKAEKEDNRKTQKPDLTQISKDLPDGWQVYLILLSFFKVFQESIELSF